MGAQGTVTLDFGAFPGASDASVAVTGQSTIGSGSLVEAWIFPATTADHSADEHWVETLMVMAGNVIAGTGFTIYGRNTSETFAWDWATSQVGAGLAIAPGLAPQTGLGTRIYGKWNVAWVWN